MDEVASYNRKRWSALADAGALFTRPRLNLDPESAAKMVDPHGAFGELRGRRVLCLAGGGGQQSAAFALLGADVTVADLSPDQIERDRTAAEHYALSIRTVEADMRDLSALEPNSFDLVDQPYSINFVPDCRDVFHQVARVLAPGGMYRFVLANPFSLSALPNGWNGEGYVVGKPYADGSEISYADQEWVYERGSGKPAAQPIEYIQTLGRAVNGLFDHGLRIIHFSDSDDVHPDADGEPGTWEHYTAFFPPWFRFLTRLDD